VLAYCFDTSAINCLLDLSPGMVDDTRNFGELTGQHPVLAHQPRRL